MIFRKAASYIEKRSRLARSDDQIIKIDFSNDIIPVASDGFSDAEPLGRWTDGATAKLVFPAAIMPSSGILTFEIEASAFVPPIIEAQKVDVLVNSIRCTTWIFNAKKKSGLKYIHIKLPVADRVGDLTLEFFIHEPVRPADLANSTDDCRALGLAVKAITLTHVAHLEKDADVVDLGIFRKKHRAITSVPDRKSNPDPQWLFPVALSTHIREPMKLAIIGTCTAEALVDNAKRNRHIADHFLMNSWLPNDIPDISGREYDAVVVHLTLRFVLHQVISRWDDDVMHTRMSEEEQTALIAAGTELLQKLVDKFMNGLPPGVPVFFMSFNEPISTHRGLFWNNRKTSLYRLVRSLNDNLAEILENTRGGYYLELNDLRQYYGDMLSYDGYRTHLTHSANDSPEFYGGLMSRIDQALQILAPIQPIKLIVTDLDNTLWKGVLAEEDEIVNTLLVEGWPLGYTEALMECKRRGILLAISSKNDEQFIRENFSKVYGLRITLDDFCSIKVGWNPKSESIKEILQEVNLLPQNVLFIDDNPLEIAEVQQAIPGIRVLTGEPSAWRMILHYAPETQVSVVTQESSNRTELIRVKLDRDREMSGGDRLTYLQSLDIRIKTFIINGRSDSRFSRSFELINKTNQFNTTGRRWSEQECEELFANGGELIALSAGDKHAEHGIVAVAILHENRIEQVVMSCRVFGLGIETAFLNCVMRRLLAVHPEINARFQSTGRNASCEKYFPNAGFALVDDIYCGGNIPEFPAWISEG